MNAICSQCDNVMELGKSRTATCKLCGANYELDKPTGRFNARSKGEMILASASKQDVIQAVRTRTLGPKDQIADENGPWIPVERSTFRSYLSDSAPEPEPANAHAKPARAEKTKSPKQPGTLSRMGLVWLVLFLISFTINVVFFLLIYWQKTRIDELVTFITGGS